MNINNIIKTRYIICLIICLLTFSIGKDIVGYISNTFLFKIAALFISDTKNDILFGIIVFAFIILALKRNKLFSIFNRVEHNRFGYALVVFICYVVIRSDSNLVSFYFCNKIYYFDVIIFGIISLIYRRYNYKELYTNAKPNDIKLIEDNATEVDSLDRAKLAENLADIINVNTVEKSFSIAIIGDWGTGKSSFMKFIENELKRKDDNIIINFNPSFSDDHNVIIKNFFQSFICKINELDSAINTYVRLLINATGGYSNVLGKLWNDISGNQEDIDSVKEKINNSIKKSGKRFIVFIDDIDRLKGDEILLVLKIIRNAADFSNVFFVVGIDYGYTEKALKSTNIENPSLFLEKFFQLKIVLPPIGSEKIEKDILFKKLKECLNYDNKHQSEQEKIDSIMSYCKRDNFKTIREVIQFSNSFNFIYTDQLELHVVFKDLFLLELIKLKYPIVYQALANRDIKFIGDGDDSYKGTKEFYEKHKITETEEVDNLIRALRTKMDEFSPEIDESKDDYWSVIHEGNHLIYFNTTIFQGKVSISEFREIVDESDFAECLKIIKSNNEKLEDWEFILDKHPIDINKADFIKFTKIKFYLDFEGWKHNIKESLTDISCDWLKGKEEIVRAEKINIIEEIVSIDDIDDDKIIFNKIILARAFLIDYFNGINIYNKEDITSLQYIIYKLFKRYIGLTQGFSGDTLDAYYANISGKNEKNEWVLSDEANKEMLEFIKDYPFDYLKILLRPSMLILGSTGPQDGDIYTFEPFLPQTFGGYENFKTFLSDLIGDEKQTKLKDFIEKKFEQFKNNEYKSITISAEDAEYLKELASKS